MGLFKRAGRPADSVSPAEDRQDGVTDPAGSDVSESYCRTETITLPWGDESVLVHVQGTESAQALPKFIADLPRYCDTFKPLRDHAIAICERFKLSHHDVGAIEEHLASLAELGVLTSKSRVLEGCRDRASAAPEQRRAIASTVIPTCKRLEPALRCLQDNGTVACSRFVDTQAGADLTQSAVPARWLASPAVHVKSIVVDGTYAYLGSENLSYTSLTKNREIGIVLSDAPAIATMLATFEKDWAAATAF
jgi:hypothetical protein